ncbi:MAG: methylenetetrahydrofolate reductase [Pseudomonadota bacterium]
MATAEKGGSALPNATGDAAMLKDLVTSASFEATPSQIAKNDDLGDLLPAGTSVYIPYLPGSDLSDTIGAAPRLISQGLKPVPHIPARTLQSVAELDTALGQLADHGVDTVLLIAGDTTPPAGPFPSTLEILETGLLERHGITKIAVAGHPEGHPNADRDELDRAMRAKSDYAQKTGAEMWVVTQFIFDTEALIAWDDYLCDQGFTLPVHVGLPGPAKLRTLLNYAMQCGVSASARMLAKRPSSMRLLGRWAPDDMVHSLATRKAERGGDTLLQGLHIYPFGGLTHAANWLHKLDT